MQELEKDFKETNFKPGKIKPKESKRPSVFIDIVRKRRNALIDELEESRVIKLLMFADRAVIDRYL